MTYNLYNNLVKLIFFSFIFLSCATSKVQNQVKTNALEDDVFFFSGERPIVNIIINGEVFQFLIDTGTNYNLLTRGGIKKIIKRIQYYDYETIRKKPNTIINLHNEKIGDIKFNIETNDTTALYDGILGMPFLMQKSNTVTFDFINHKIIFLPNNLNGMEEKLIPVSVENYPPLYFMEIKLNDSTEYFIIDTGNQTVALRSNYDDEKSEYPTEELLLSLLNNDYNKTNRFKKLKLPDFSYSSTKYNNLVAVYNDYIFSKADGSARKMLSKFSSAGVPFFENRIVQINFDNNTIIIVNKCSQGIITRF
jgi:hypothetical protein